MTVSERVSDKADMSRPKHRQSAADDFGAFRVVERSPAGFRAKDRLVVFFGNGTLFQQAVEERRIIGQLQPFRRIEKVVNVRFSLLPPPSFLDKRRGGEYNLYGNI